MGSNCGTAAASGSGQPLAQSMASVPVSDFERVRFLDFARGFAIMSIVVFHALRPMATGVWAMAILFGGAGVHAFIFLSGFGLELATNQRSMRGFYRRRFRRIIVPYFVFITGLFLLNLRWSIYPEHGLEGVFGPRAVVQDVRRVDCRQFWLPLLVSVDHHSAVPRLSVAVRARCSVWELPVSWRRPC